MDWIGLSDHHRGFRFSGIPGALACEIRLGENWDCGSVVDSAQWVLGHAHHGLLLMDACPEHSETNPTCLKQSKTRTMQVGPLVVDATATSPKGKEGRLRSASGAVGAGP